MAYHPDNSDTTLDTLLGALPTPEPPPGIEDAVIAAIRQEESLAAYRRALYKRLAAWLTAGTAAACLCALLLPGTTDAPTPPSRYVAIDDVMVVDDALNAIPDDELFTAICAVSDPLAALSDY